MTSNPPNPPWSPGRLHWIATTIVALIGAVTGVISLIMNYFYHPGAPPTTIDSSYSQFSKLSYADRLDLCVPYIANNIDEWRHQWINSINSNGGLRDPRINVTAPIGVKDSPGQAIINNMIAISDFSQKRAQTDEGKNIASCEGAPSTHVIETTFGSGNNAPTSAALVEEESPIFYQGNFAGVPASGEASRVVKVTAVVETTGGVPTKGVTKEYGFALVSGRDETHTLWAITAILHQNQKGWVDDVQHFTGG